MKPLYLKLFISLFVLLIGFDSTAQSSSTLADGDPPSTPIDSQMIGLAIAGIMFALYFFNSKKVVHTK
jgi:mannose/fructose/N-acetylgalactosamine-specific phosphotransferase system component IIC